MTQTSELGCENLGVLGVNAWARTWSSPRWGGWVPGTSNPCGSWIALKNWCRLFILPLENCSNNPSFAYDFFGGVVYETWDKNIKPRVLESDPSECLSIWKLCDPGPVSLVLQPAVTSLSGNGTSVNLIELRDDPCEVVNHLLSM